jgi:antitoxin component of MazEF toxin-antitoxin module
MHRTVKRVGGSLAVIIPRDLAELLQLKEETPVDISIVGWQLIVEPVDHPGRKTAKPRAKGDR